MTSITAPEAQAELDRLTARVQETKEAYADARNAAERTWEAGQDVAAQLAAHHHRKLTRQPHSADPAEPRRLTVDLLRRIENEDLLLEPLDPARPAAGLKIVDPRPVRRLQEAQDEATAARAERGAFQAECRALLDEASARAKVTRVTEALDGSDPGALRDALSELDPTGPGPLTTDDLQVLR